MKMFLRFLNCSTQTSLYDNKLLDIWDFKKSVTVREMKTKALVITRLICAFVFASVDNEFSHNAAPMHLFM